MSHQTPSGSTFALVLVAAALVTCDGTVGPPPGNGQPDGGPPRSSDAGAPDAGDAGGPVSSDAGLPDAGDGGRVVDDPDAGSPWGVSTSAQSSRAPGGWQPAMAQAGVRFVRGFDQAQPEASIDAAAAQHLELSGILMKSGPGSVFTFPPADSAWSAYVSGLVQRALPAVTEWEVWNEPPNFTADQDPKHYGELVAKAYDAAKAVSPSVRIGLAAKSVHVNWLAQAIEGGAAGHYDFITLHPYETLGLVDRGWEAQFLATVPTVRKLLRAKDPSKVNVPIIFTELGEPVGAGVSPAHQAGTVVKSYVLSLAQGVARIHWFEGRDGDSGPFGLLDATGAPRPAYTALKTLIAELGSVPRYRGWVLLKGSHFGFVFEAERGPVLIAWAQPGTSEALVWPQPVRQVDPITGVATATSTTTLTPSPVLITQAPATLVTEALGNRAKPFPWAGDFTAAQRVSLTAPAVEAGLHPLAELVSTTVDGEAARDCSTSAQQPFTVDPNFLSYDTVPIRITVVLKRNAAATAAGFNLIYESTSGTKSTGTWYTIPDATGWVTQSWTITDAQFVGMWGYHFAFNSDSTANSHYSLKSVTVTKL